MKRAITNGVRRFYEFGPFRLDLNRHRVLRDGEVVPLSPKAIQTLTLLVQNPGELLEREALMQAVWPDVTVEDANLTVAISQLRKALNQNGDAPEFIETIPRVGYRFVADIREVIEEPAPLILEERTRSQPIKPIADNRETNGTTTAPPELQAKISLLPEHRTQRRLIVALVLCLTIAAAAIADRFVKSSSSAPANISSVAVLPLRNLTGDPNAEYLSDGITESIISQLSRVPELKVISRASVFTFKGKEIDPREAGRRLGVGNIVEGSLLKSKDRIRAQVELVSAVDGHIIWSGDSYERAAADIFEVQDEISCNVAEHLQTVLCADRPAARRSTENVAAYEAYLKGQYYMAQRTAESLMKAIQFFQQATEIDPNYAVAYCDLAESYKLAVWYVPMPASEAVPKLQAAATKAIELDSSLAEAHEAMAEVYSFQWKWKESVTEHQRSLALNPGYAAAHHGLGLGLALLGRNAEALAHIERARELDPLSLIINTDYGWVYYLERRYDEAIAQYKQALELDPNFTLAHFDLALSYSALGRHEDAISEMQKARERGSDYLAGLGYVYAMAGRRAEALKTLDDLKRLAEKQYVPPYHFGWVYTGLGDKDKAIALLQKTYDEHTQHVIDFKTVPLFDGLRTDPRFQELVQKVGLPD